MRISYNKLWKILIDKGLKKQDLQKMAGMSAATMAKLGKGDNVTTDVLLKIASVLNCKVEEYLETIDD